MFSSRHQTIGPDEIHIWQLQLNDDLDHANFSSFLSPDERLRASRYSVIGPRQRFISVRSRLRVLLGHYLAVPPSDLVFAQNPCGKPYVNRPECTLQFNLSHSNDLCLIALAQNRNVGIDVESTERTLATDEIARFFAPKEQIALAQLANTEERRRMVFRYWTQKEACLKAVGAGLTIDLAAIDVNPMQNRWQLICIAGTDPWPKTFQVSVKELKLDDSHVAAVATAGSSKILCHFKWSELYR